MGNMSASATTTLSGPPSLAALRARRDEILRLAARRGVSHIRVFGSVARGEARVDSDIDLLVDFDTSHRGLDLFAFAREVEELIGHRVDVGTDVHPVVRRKVETEAGPLGPTTTTRSTSHISARL